MKPIIKAISYLPPEQVLLRLADEPGLCFLDSAQANSRLSRYSYIGIDPFFTMKSKGNKIWQQQAMINGNPFDVLQQRLTDYKTETVSDLPPFQGGVMGYFAYDLLHHLENIPEPKCDEINIPDLYVGFYDCILAFDMLEKRAWIISHGFPEKNIDARMQRAQQRLEQLLQKVSTEVSNQVKQIAIPASAIASNFNQETYCAAIQKTIDYIYAGDIFQANISQCFKTKSPKDLQPIDLYLQLRSKNPAPFAAFLAFDGVCLGSASPERFIQLSGNHVETRPIKGTCTRSDDKQIDASLALALQHSEKDLAENTMIVDLMRNDLSRVCRANSVKVTQCCGLESFETVHHLVSEIKAELLPKYDAIDLLKATFPGGSITGAPKIRAMEIIASLEPSTRGAYCGSIGYIGFNGDMDTSITIRTYTITHNHIYFQAGGGIVADSKPKAEYDESLLKAAALKHVLLGEGVNNDLVH